jgi:hypothetical protein
MIVKPKEIDIAGMYYGTVEVQAAYLGDTLVYKRNKQVVIKSAKFSENPANINEKITLTVVVEEV